jgi:hypothetical protein
MMRTGLALVGMVLAGCGGRAGDDAAAAADSTPALTLADIAGRWAMQAWRDTGSAVLTTYEIVGTTDPASWQILFPDRQPVPLRVTVAGDSMVAEAGPFESVLRKGVAVVTRTVSRLEGGRLVGTFMARYATNMVDSVLTGRTEGTRVP